MHIFQSAERVSLKRQSNHVTLSMSTAFANYWMVPRLATFRAHNPEIDIRLQTTDKDIDLASEAVALEIRQGVGDWPGHHAHRLADEVIYPICSPGHLAQITVPGDVGELTACDLIHLEEPFRARPTWSEWFANQGVSFKDRGEGLRLNDYALVIQAAIAGQGIAMGWHHLVSDLVAQGLLVQVLDQTYDEGTGFYVVWSKASELSPEAEQVLDWLKVQTA